MQLTPSQRDELGKIAHDEWVIQQQSRDPGMLLGYAPWQTLSEAAKEPFRVIAEAVAQHYATMAK